MPTKAKKSAQSSTRLPSSSQVAGKKAAEAKASPSPAKKAARTTVSAKGEPVRSIQDDLPVLSFQSSEEFEAWMHEHHQEAKGLWLRMYKKGTNVKTVSRAEAIDVVLCFGWIDGVANKYDEASFLQRFTPRRAKSIWSKVNVDHVARLVKAKRMQPRGFKEVEAAKADGRWDQAYNPPSKSTIPEDFLALVKKNKAAYTFFQTLNKTNLFAICWRLETAKKPETRVRRMETIVAMLEEGKKFH
ncbi:YdeI/OmpD-associated family protein [Paraflavitalea pollutisoli]|uniref:YdeI/OmpD-associated family protein n=1 Tax=Paraflavitalea pollutisoli TaxID=3034143 RepID=UPI0023EE0BFC|nr:YdeI/OmpD-associated family protein [Paraflavitalea sp. H1-2-19X]